MNKEKLRENAKNTSDALLFFLEKHYWSATIFLVLFWLIIGILFPPPIPPGGIGGCL